MASKGARPKDRKSRGRQSSKGAGRAGGAKQEAFPATLEMLADMEMVQKFFGVGNAPDEISMNPAGQPRPSKDKKGPKEPPELPPPPTYLTANEYNDMMVDHLDYDLMGMTDWAWDPSMVPLDFALAQGRLHLDDVQVPVRQSPSLVFSREGRGVPGVLGQGR